MYSFISEKTTTDTPKKASEHQTFIPSQTVAFYRACRGLQKKNNNQPTNSGSYVFVHVHMATLTVFGKSCSLIEYGPLLRSKGVVLAPWYSVHTALPMWYMRVNPMADILVFECVIDLVLSDADTSIGVATGLKIQEPAVMQLHNMEWAINLTWTLAWE